MGATLTISRYCRVRAGREPVRRPAEDLDEVRRLARDEDVFGAAAGGMRECEVVLYRALREEYGCVEQSNPHQGWTSAVALQSSKKHGVK